MKGCCKRGIVGWEGRRSCLLVMSPMAGCCRAAVVAGASMEVVGEAGASRAQEAVEGSCTGMQ